MSCFTMLPDDVVERGIARLAADLEDGTWHARHAALLETTSLDLGYRLLVSER
jgi:hypothetical protein